MHRKCCYCQPNTATLIAVQIHYVMMACNVWLSLYIYKCSADFRRKLSQHDGIDATMSTGQTRTRTETISCISYKSFFWREFSMIADVEPVWQCLMDGDFCVIFFSVLCPLKGFFVMRTVIIYGYFNECLACVQLMQDKYIYHPIVSI